RVGLEGVLDRLDRAGTPCEVPGEAAGRGFTWDDGDREDPQWWPQGVTVARGGDVLLVAWYAKRDRYGRSAGSRVTVVDVRDPDRPRYRHVLLVTDRRALSRVPGGRVVSHAGGLTVVGGLLLVADTATGLRVFRLDDVLAHPGGQLVLPQLRRVRQPRLRRGALHWSFLSAGDVDGEKSLVVGEYGRKGSTPRLVRYPLDPATGLPATGADGRCLPRGVHEQQPLRMQGVAVVGQTWFVTASAGEGRPGDLHVGRPGAWTTHRGVLPTGPEDLDAGPGGELWCATEWPGRRWVFAVDPARWVARPV
ncbi:MAG: hypothetical protein JWO60_1494, partial [Frankiales bacterium]|nr:hypothetical protein [Frankiales bacterium]